MTGCVAMRLTFGQWLRIQRDTAGLSQQGLADALGVTRQTVGNWEGKRSEAQLSLGQAKKLAALFEVPLELVAKAAANEIEVEG
jgi:transcriptional regulator with XRE-family HTH domain